ncbi:hypothetical protein [Methylomonas sp. MgM2]
MRKFIAPLVVSGLLMTGNPIQAETDTSINIPENVHSNILKRHPSAHEMRASEETHFGQQLLEVTFKDENEQQIIELFTAKGHVFTNELKVEGLSGVSSAAIATLEREFPSHTLQKTELVVNPNGVGEEYEIYLRANGYDWKVCINERGELKEKRQLIP